jgi:aminomethyltransferase
MTLKRSPLDAEHRALGATMVEFGGWEMPIAYPSGTIDEHLACRHRAVMFDVSHLGTVRVEGADALARLQATLTNDLTKIEPGRAQYTHLLDPTDASVADDVIVWWRPDDPEAFDVMPNASNTVGVQSMIGGVDVTDQRAIIAVQGPHAKALVATVCPDAAAVGRFRVAVIDWNGVTCTVAGTGYTGEDGVEIALAVDAAPQLWRALADAGVQPAGLGARDTLRLEAGLALHGHELGPGITSLQAGLGWVVAWNKPEFVGRDVALAERERGITRRLIGIATEGRRPARAGCAISIDGIGGLGVVGEVTSGNFSPVLGHGIALGFMPPDTPEGTAVIVDVRGKDLPGRVASTPFVRR